MSTRTTSLRHSTRLKWSLLAAVGIVPLACGGKSTGDSDDEPIATPNAGGTGGVAGKPASKAGTSNAGVGGSDPVASTKPTCTAPKHDALRGLVHCAEGYTYRPAPFACAAVDGPPYEEPPGIGGAGGVGATSGVGGTTGDAPEPGRLPRADGSVSCASDERACQAFELGYCDSGFEWYDDQGIGGQASAVCRSGCATDNDCGAGSMCLCSGGSPSGGRCVESSCRSDADCESGYHCASYSGGCATTGWSCQTAKDTCWGDAECGDGEGCYPEDEQRDCRGLWVCGRPFLVERTARTAQAVCTGDWIGGARPRLDNLSGEERAAFARHFTHLGLLEHASIAAFARFSLQLLSLGAPADLIERCTSALADETEHARLCFQLASAYAGHAVGPGPLDVSSSLEASSLPNVVDLVIAEGCFGETMATLEALDAAAAASDPVLIATYDRIARDEQRHAELAFRFVRWALARDAAAVAPRLRAAIEAPPSTRSAAQEVVLPCLRELLAVTVSAAA